MSAAGTVNGTTAVQARGGVPGASPRPALRADQLARLRGWANEVRPGPGAVVLVGADVDRRRGAALRAWRPLLDRAGSPAVYGAVS